MPKVSVIVPIYNVEEYMQKCLDSLINQTLEDLEIILVNDGSTDNSVEIAKKYERKNKEKIKLLEKENGGLSDARNFGIPYATGEYIAFLDSDDYIEDNTYELMYNKAIEENADMVECDFFWKYPKKIKIDTGKIYNGKHEMIKDVRVVAWNKLIKRNIIINNNIYFPKGLRYEDVEFTYKLIPYINKVSFVKTPLIYYIQRKNSIANSQNERTSEIFTVLDNTIKFYKEKNLYNEYAVEIEYIYTRFLLCSSFKRMCKIKDNKIRKKLLNQTWQNLNYNFPKWHNNEILLHDKSKKGEYIRSINKISYKIYSNVFRWL